MLKICKIKLNTNVRLIVIFGLFHLFFLHNINAQQDTTKQNNSPIRFGLGVLSGVVFNEHPPKTPSDDPLGYEVFLESFIEKKILQNVSTSVGLDLCFFKGMVGNNSSSYINVQDSSILIEDKIGDVTISSFRLKIPFRLRLYYLTREKIRIFAEPGIFGLVELKSHRKYVFQKTIYYDLSSQMYLNPPSVESLEEQIKVKKMILGLALSMGVELNTREGQTFFLNAQYQRARLYFEPRKSVVNHLLGLKFRYLLHNKKSKQKIKTHD